MTNLRRFRELRASKHEIVILAPLEPGAKPACLLDQGSSVDSQVREVVLTKQQLRIPPALEMRMMAPPLLVELVSVAVDEIGVRMLVDLGRDQVQRMLGDLVVMIEQSDELTGGHVERAVRGRGDVPVPLAMNHSNASIESGVLIQDLSQCSSVDASSAMHNSHRS